MTKHNAIVRKSKPKATPRLPVMNMAGGSAFIDNPKVALYKQVATSLWSGDGYYERQVDWYRRFIENIDAVMSVDPVFPFKLAEYARSKTGLALRTSAVALYVEAANHLYAKNTGLVRQYAPRVLLRADEPAEAIAYFKKHYPGQPLPHGMLRGIADTLPKFNEYQLAKYKGDRNAVKLRDVFRLARPRPKSHDQSVLWNKAVKGNLEVPYTWEVELSRAGSNAEKAAVWNDLLKSGKLPIFALIRNLRNIAQSGADTELALSQITRERVVGSGILPFQIYKAYLAVKQNSHRENFMSEKLLAALTWSLEGVEKLKGRTLVVCDNSGSMETGAVTRGLSNKDLGNLFGAMSMFVCENAQAGTFGETFSIARDASMSQSVAKNKDAIDRCGNTTGHSTEAWKVFDFLTRQGAKFDRVILMSDMQCYNTSTRHYSYGGGSLSDTLKEYKQKVNPDVALYSINLASNDNTTQFDTDDNVVELAGWSDSILRFIAAIEQPDITVDLLEQSIITDEIVAEIIAEETDEEGVAQ